VSEGAAVEIREISLPRDVTAFVRCWWPIYRDDPHWVPPLVFERKRFFDPSVNPYFDVAEVQCFIAYRNGVAVGTIGAAVDHNYQREDPGAGFFGFFEFPDDEEISRPLFVAATAWLREKGMKRALGPFNFNSNHEFGLLVDGFDTDPMIANPHNGPWFERHYLALGLEPVMDWYAYWLETADFDERVVRIANRMLARNPEIIIRNVDMKHFDREVVLMHGIYDDAWEHNWGHVKMERAEFEYLAAGFRQFIDPRFVFVVEVGGEAVGLSVTFPDMNTVVKKMNGSLFPFGWFHFLVGKRKIDQVRIFMLGVKQEYQNLPLGALLYAKTFEASRAAGIRGGEASLILENNDKMRGALEKMGAEIYKTYRSYEVRL
jgi:GNAT superfamily N-acetyltransferase